MIGASTQNTAARILEAEAGIRSTSITQLLWEAEAKGYGLPRGGVVVIDEAAMASTRALADPAGARGPLQREADLGRRPGAASRDHPPGSVPGALRPARRHRAHGGAPAAGPHRARRGRAGQAGEGSSAIEAYDERGRLALHDSIADLEAAVVADRHRAHQKTPTRSSSCAPGLEPAASTSSPRRCGSRRGRWERRRSKFDVDAELARSFGADKPDPFSRPHELEELWWHHWV